MTDSQLPPDPFGPPEDTITLMKGLQQLHISGQAAGLSESVMTQFISNVFVSFFMMQNAAQEQEEK